MNAELKFVQEAAQDDQPGKLEAVNGLQRTIKSIKENIQRLEQEQKKVVTYDIPGLLESNWGKIFRIQGLKGLDS